MVLAFAGSAAWTSSSLTDADLEAFFRGRTVDGHYAAALKKRSVGGAAYLATVHGYPDNLSVCEQLIEPYNKEASKSILPGEYYCEALR